MRGQATVFSGVSLMEYDQQQDEQELLARAEAELQKPLEEEISANPQESAGEQMLRALKTKTAAEVTKAAIESGAFAHWAEGEEEKKTVGGGGKRAKPPEPGENVEGFVPEFQADTAIDAGGAETRPTQPPDDFLGLPKQPEEIPDDGEPPPTGGSPPGSGEDEEGGDGDSAEDDPKPSKDS